MRRKYRIVELTHSETGEKMWRIDKRGWLFGWFPCYGGLYSPYYKTYEAAKKDYYDLIGKCYQHEIPESWLPSKEFPSPNTPSK